MRPSRFLTLIKGLFGGLVYSMLMMALVSISHANVSISYLFVLPLIMGAIPVLFATHEELSAYKDFLLLPWGISALFFALAIGIGLEGFFCVAIIIGPFFILGTLGAFIMRVIRLRRKGGGRPLYISLIAPLLILVIESYIPADNHRGTVRTSILANAPRTQVWSQIKNVRDIRRDELRNHFVHLIGVPKPLDGRLDREGVGGVRRITWEKGIRFREHITSWTEGRGFSYDIDVDPASIPPGTLDEHVMISGRYFDVEHGSYTLDSLGLDRTWINLSCDYRVTTNLNGYSKWWANFILNDFQETILEVVKNRSEKAF